MLKNKIILLSLIFIILCSSCLVVKHPDTGDVTTTVSLSPKPEIDMSDEIVRSKQGDIISFIPKDWFFVDVKEDVSSDIFAVAVNPDYTLSAVFSVLRKSDQVDKTIEKEGLLGLARLSYTRRERKSAGSVILAGKYQPLEIGTNAFFKYEFTSRGGTLKAQAVVFKSSLNQFYEFALIPMDFTGKTIPPQEEIDKTFRSIVTTIKF
jgi:hypothetical protein